MSTCSAFAVLDSAIAMSILREIPWRSTHREMINEHFLSIVLILEPELSIRSQEEVDGDVARQRVEWRLPEAGDDGTLPLDRDHLREEALRGVDGGMVDLE